MTVSVRGPQTTVTQQFYFCSAVAMISLLTTAVESNEIKLIDHH